MGARFGLTLEGGGGSRAIAGLTGSLVEYRRMDALDVRELAERFEVALCFGILHRVTDPIALLRALADVLAAGGEVVLETYGSRLPATAPAIAIEVHEPGDVYARDDFVYKGNVATTTRMADWRRSHVALLLATRCHFVNQTMRFGDSCNQKADARRAREAGDSGREEDGVGATPSECNSASASMRTHALA